MSNIAPDRGVPFAVGDFPQGNRRVEVEVIPTFRTQAWMEDVSRTLNSLSSLSNAANGDTQFISDTYTILNTDAGVVADTSTLGFTVTLPDASLVTNQSYFVQNVGSANTLTVETTNSQLIAGASSMEIPFGLPYPCPHFRSDGSAWIILGFIA